MILLMVFVLWMVCRGTVKKSCGAEQQSSRSTIILDRARTVTDYLVCTHVTLRSLSNRSGHRK